MDELNIAAVESELQRNLYHDIAHAIHYKTLDPHSPAFAFLVRQTIHYNDKQKVAQMIHDELEFVRELTRLQDDMHVSKWKEWIRMTNEADRRRSESSAD
jgi:hypothetical protein